MSEIITVLDSSAILCIYFDEPGADRVHDIARGALVSAVNLAEVVSKLQERGVKKDVIEAIMADFNLEVIAFDKALAIATGELRNATRSKGLSLGDRACLALASSLGVTAVTTDQAWKDLDGSVRVMLVR